ncbi:hypothetical protein ASPACDRAFT_24798 [Aspergillus aculeatus ATCC 16872]|uniref:Amino acid permease/ SLC12A domain-containing protein n=1 Tax=Aspergillus aculeatus (strain ATCC 16872 / CBS 172.66 / WB 5094) TaxID=690307 RepID=A0A1L9X162_ASPA1|nr:uncharacterized protein ASPACDRAFT_24798 [Aspergillus aculeatus ATCC 16872]OJK02255.1 hypothetical protein ASPACDRAFT_24798 [Aspergillus aculeatus ATCC 16872]
MSEDKIDRKLEEAVEADVQSCPVEPLAPQGLQRRLNNRQTQLLAIGGSIGTALFISIGNGLAAGGPGSLLVAYTLYALVIGCINNCVAEMTVLQPVSGGFIRLAGKWVDDALGFMVGWNFFFYEALMIPYEITAINLVLGVINFLAVRAYGEAEFWLSSGKILLIFTLIFFTFITMVGGNPQHDAYGFRYWRHPSAFAEYRHSGNTGQLEGFLAALWSAAFTIVGPEYISMSAAEAQRPRTVVKAAFKTIYWRFGLFFVLGATCVGIVVPWTDPTLQAILHGQSSASGAAASPYVIAMANLQITGLPHLVNALLITSIFSAGNTLTYCATRSLYGLAIEGRAPRVLTKTRNGVPVYAFGVVICFPFLSFLQLSNSSAKVLNLLVSLMTAGALIDFLVMCITYLQFYRACKVQGLDRGTLPYVGWGQPYCAWVGVVAMVFVLLGSGYTAFAPWDVQTFFENYTMQLVAPVLFFGWKWAKGTTLLKPEEVDLVWEAPAVDAYEASFEEPMPGFWEEVVGLVWRRGRGRGRGDQG